MYKLGNKRLNLWDEPFMQKEGMTVELKVLYVYLLSNVLSNIAGVYKITDRRILFDLCNPNLDLKAMFNQLRNIKKVYRCGDYVIIKDAPLYIKKMTKSVIKEINEILNELPNKIKEKMRRVHYRYEPLYKSESLSKNFQAELFDNPIAEDSKKNNKEKKAVEHLPINNSLREGEDEEIDEKHRKVLQANEGGLLVLEGTSQFCQNGEDNKGLQRFGQKTEVKAEAKGDLGLKEELKAQPSSIEDSTSSIEEAKLQDEIFKGDMSDEEIKKQIRESDAFFENFARNARSHAIREQRKEVLQHMKGMKKASELAPNVKPIKTNLCDKKDVCKDSNNNNNVNKNSMQPKPHIELKSSTIKEPQDVENLSTTESTPNTFPIYEQQLENACNANSDAFEEILLNQKTQHDEKKNICDEPILQTSPTLPRKVTEEELNIFQKAYAKEVYKKFQNAGLYQGVDYLYFYRYDFLKGLSFLKDKAITVEDMKEAYAVNELIDSYLEKSKHEKDEGKRCIMAFYKMCALV